MMTTIRRTACGLGAAAALAGLAVGCAKADAASPRRFENPEAASAALVAAAASYDRPALRAILGDSGVTLVESRDTVLASNTAKAFAAQAKVRQRVELDSSGNRATLIVGAEDWPLPIPIVKDDGTWKFDVAAGRDEILRRRIGMNEFDAIDVCRDYVEAQHLYSFRKHDGAIVNQYAQRVISTPGKQDGLAWRDPDGSWRGPLGETIARYIAEGYKDRYEPFHGYYFRILKGQGPHAPMGQMDFVVEGAMIGGFALVAAPSDYLVTGVKTFMVGPDGIVYEKDFGDRTLDNFRTMQRYDPDSTWTAVREPVVQ
jgi:hypothetical protein